jgi:hypothetical protein
MYRSVVRLDRDMIREVDVDKPFVPMSRARGACLGGSIHQTPGVLGQNLQAPVINIEPTLVNTPRAIRPTLTHVCAILKFDGPLGEWAPGLGSLARVELVEEGRCGYRMGHGMDPSAKCFWGGRPLEWQGCAA